MSTTMDPAGEITAAREIVERLHATCCVPDRSPRMIRLTATLDEARRALETDAATATDLLAEAGAQVGWLQVACCADKRLPLYTEILGRLTAAHRGLEDHGH